MLNKKSHSEGGQHNENYGVKDLRRILAFKKSPQTFLTHNL
jgi:hypothetical protein